VSSSGHIQGAHRPNGHLTSDAHVSEEWGKKAAARVFHICDSGKDIEIDDPFALGAATEKPIRYLAPVQRAPERALTKYDVAQALSFVATQS
jgi:hypothetical protein